MKDARGSLPYVLGELLKWLSSGLSTPLKILIECCIFLVYIVAFGYFYVYISDHFYYSTADKEIHYEKTRAKITNDLRQEIRNSLVRIEPSEPTTLPYRLEQNELQEFKSQLWHSKLVSEPIKANGETLEYSGTFFVELNRLSEVHCNSTIVSLDKNVFISCVFYDFSSGARPIDENFPDFRLHALKEDPDSAYFNLFHPETGVKVGSELRMLYFSSVTATTLGYGEIVPISDLARTAVALQSVMGLILMGSIVAWVSRA